jgi:hypothetical protein
MANHAIANALDTSRPTVQLWRKRFAGGGLKALTEIEKGRGRKPAIPPDKVAKVRRSGAQVDQSRPRRSQRS